MIPTRHFLLVLALVVGQAAAQEGPRAMIPDVPPLPAGPDCTMDSLTRAVNAGYGEGLPDHYLPGLSGVAFLATVCQDHCLCRDYREIAFRWAPALDGLGYASRYVDGAKIPPDEAWRALADSLGRGVPAVAFNLFGDMEDEPLVGYDEEKDLLWGVKPGGGAEYDSVPLSTWRSQTVFGYVVEARREGTVDRRRVERDRLVEVVAAAVRPPLEGG
ncbi:MAG: hypothetical protein HY720_24910 [Planctomycetes bacterium]|nr:hypothetical protein [Planctomycetota bacterium]